MGGDLWGKGRGRGGRYHDGVQACGEENVMEVI